MLIVTVLKLGKNFLPNHAQWLHSQLSSYESVCLTDAGNIPGVKTIPLQHNWPGWWSKIELFNPKHPVIGKRDIFFIDIDTVITGDLTELMKTAGMVMLTDFFGIGHNAPNLPLPASGVMKIPYEYKESVWEKFLENPKYYMEKCTTKDQWGDQGFIGSIYPNVLRWQNIHPGKIISYKAHIANSNMTGFHHELSLGNGHLPKDSRIVCFHGNPRPWEVKLPWIPQFTPPTILQQLLAWKKRNIF
ncbi:hypothetical protein [Pectobacterium sp. B1J-3]|uniref:hypothetical protein n=1 Tax=Pectobacterium sp. B1J-3 TaxID=3385371 RepID=UPI00390659ED